MALRIVKNFDIDANYAVLSALYSNLCFNNEKELELSRLNEFFDPFMKKIQERLDENPFEKEKKIVNLTKSLDDALKEENEYYYLKDGKVILKDNVTIDSLEEALKKFEFHNSFESIIRYDKNLKDILNLHRIKEMLTNYYEIERKIYGYYTLYQQGDVNYLSKIKDLLNQRNSFYYNLLVGNNDLIDDCYSEIGGLCPEDPYENCYPVDKKFLDEEPDFNEYAQVDEVLQDAYMYAIFSNSLLGFDRMSEDITNLMWNNHFVLLPQSVEEEQSDYIANDMRERAINNNGKFVYTVRRAHEKFFYMTVIKMIDEIQAENGQNESLQNVKARLLYLIDDIGTNLLEGDNFEKDYNKVKLDLEEDEDFEWWKRFSKETLKEIFEKDTDEDLILKKIAVIKAYYELTKDEEITNILNNYKDNKYKSLIKGKGKKLEMFKRV